MSAVRLALLQAQLEGVAEVMGAALARSAFSPNIRVRLDFSCALFSRGGALLAQAAHIPVHLGSMPDQIQCLVKTQDLQPGEVYIANDPYDGGTHLPDITLMEPVFCTEGQCIGVVAARAHHADVGGAAPGSMASQANIYGDGLRIPILRIASEDGWDSQLLHLILHNMRSPGDREGDLFAQKAALQQGKQGLQRIFSRWAEASMSLWEAGQRDLWKASRSGTLRALQELMPSSKVADFEDYLEVGPVLAPIKVTLSRQHDMTLLADFSGTSGGLAAGFNATLPVTKAAVCYVLRCLTPPSLHLNQGFLDCIEVKAEPGSLVHAVYPLAVAAGNVETSQRIVDVVFGAFSKLVPDKVPAASAGSMNNLSFGFKDPRYGVHYETSGGGAGACPGGPAQGCSAVQVHMTNTLSTPVEVLEEEFPVFVLRHEIKEGSGGQGRFVGGNGTLKEILFRQEVDLTFMTTRRDTMPYGLQGGKAGQSGNQSIRLPQKEWTNVASSSTHSLPKGSAIRLETPGGGGWGES